MSETLRAIRVIKEVVIAGEWKYQNSTYLKFVIKTDSALMEWINDH